MTQKEYVKYQHVPRKGKVYRVRISEGDLRFLLWVLTNQLDTVSELMKHREWVEHEAWMQKYEFIKWTSWRELVKLKEKRAELAKLKQWDLVSMHSAITDLMRRVEAWLEGKRPHPHSNWAIEDHNMVWNHKV